MRMFIDDIRNPQLQYDVIVRSSKEAINYVVKNGCPNHISFDHDLGEDDTSMIFIKWLVNEDLDNNIIPIDFNFNVHSANPIGTANINGYLGGYIKRKRKLNDSV